MKDWSHWGIKRRVYPDYNYNAIWSNLKTLRLGKGQAKELPPNHSEFYDVSLGTKCNLECPFCYTNAKKSGMFYDNVVGKAKFFFGNMDDNQKPFQIAIGSEGEPTIHPEFIEFIKTIYDLGIVPNLTTNGITIAENNYITPLEETIEKYCGGMAISANTWCEEINEVWQVALQKLALLDININIHYIMIDRVSVDEFEKIYHKYSDKVLYFVLLPLMDSGRSNIKCPPDTFEYLLTKDLDWSKIAFGAHFYDSLLQNQDKLKCWLYPPESLSKNLILDGGIKITPSSFSKEVIWQTMMYKEP